MRVVLLSGGGGGARFARGLADALPAGDLTVIGNVGDDVEILGVHVSPDLDSLLYALAGLIDDERGWGRAGETWSALASASEWGGEDWFRLGDLDLGLHLVRTQRLRDGVPLSEITAELAALRGLATSIVPATDDRLRTQVDTDAGTFPFQEWFVGRGHRDEVTGVSYQGADEARPAPLSSRRSRRPRRSCLRRATRTSRSAPSSPCARTATRSPVAAFAASL